MYSIEEKHSIEAENIAWNAVRIALRNNAIGDEYAQIARLIPQFSLNNIAQKLQRLSAGAYSADISIMPQDLQGYCYKVSDMLREELEEDSSFMRATNGTLKIANSGIIPTEIPYNEDLNRFRYHHYLSAEIQGVEIVIDPTIGQFLVGHNYVFVGTRKKLAETVRRYDSQGKLTNIAGSSVEEHIKLVWGDHPIPSHRADYPRRPRRT